MTRSTSLQLRQPSRVASCCLFFFLLLLTGPKSSHGFVVSPTVAARHYNAAARTSSSSLSLSMVMNATTVEPTTFSRATKTAPSFVSTTAAATPTVDLSWTEFTSDSQATMVKSPPVVMLHGLLGSKRNLATLGNALAKEGRHRIFGLDLRNHGETAVNNNYAPETMSYHDMAADVLAWLDQQDHQQVVLIGHSMGGKVAQAMALLYPERVAGLIVLDIAPVEYGDDAPSWKAVTDIVSTLATTQVDLLSCQSLRDVDLQLRPYIADASIRAFCLTNVDMNRKQWKIPLSTIDEQLSTLAGFIDLETTTSLRQDSFPLAATHALPYTRAPVLYVCGGQSRFVRHGHLSTIAKWFPQHTITTIRGAGHWLHAEAPDDTAALIQQYLQQVGSTVPTTEACRLSRPPL